MQLVCHIILKKRELFRKRFKAILICPENKYSNLTVEVKPIKEHAIWGSNYFDTLQK